MNNHFHILFWLLLVVIVYWVAGCSYGTQINNERGSYPNQTNTTCTKESL